jgi:hypothetical protein
MVFDGTTAWMKGPMGTRDLPGSQRDEFQKQTIGDVHYVLQNIDKPDFTPQYVRDETIEGKPVNIVIVRYAPLNYVMRLFIDAQSGFVLKKVARGMTQSGPGDIEEVFSDYRVADGVQFPFKTVATSDGKKVSEVTVTSVKVNAGVKEEVFKK